MQPQTDLALLPKRNGKTDGSFRRNLQPISFFTNYYGIECDPKKTAIYQYSFSLPEEIPQDSSVYPRAIASIKKTLRQKIGYLSHSGQMIWGSILLRVPTTLAIKFTHEENQYSFEAIIKLTKQLDLRDLNIGQYRQIYIQILNVNLKNALKSLKLNQLGKKGQYFQNKVVLDKQLSEQGLDILKGYRFTIVPLISGISLQVDVCSRVLQSRNLLEIFNGKAKAYNKETFEGATVITKYGTFRTYRIQEIDYSKSPQSTFHHEKTGSQMSYVSYYKEAYNITIKNLTQPLLKAIKSIRKQLEKNGKQYKQIIQYVYLIPEFVSPTGMTDQQRADHQMMKAIAPYTKLSPSERAKQCNIIVEDINKTQGLVQIKNPKRLEGYILPRPNLTFTGASIQPDNRGNVRNRGVLKEPFNFTDWVFLYSRGKNKERDDNDADDAYQLLESSAKAYGVKFKSPGFLTVQSSNAQDWKDVIKKDASQNGTPQIIVLYLSSYQEKIYSQLKKFITNQMKCPSQFIRKRTLTSKKGAMSAASKIVIQMNIKVGAVPWQVEKRHEYFKNRNIMYGALSISKGKKGNTLAFVGTINNQCTRVFSDCKVGIKSKENIPSADIEQIFKNWAKSYFQTNKKVPDLIILYRQGLSLPQIKAQIPTMEIPALEATIKKIGENTGTKNYNPQYMIVTVNKKINSRYFAVVQENRNNPNKFIPQIVNPDSGSIMVESLSTDDMYDFHLASQFVTQGTCTPTLFRVAYDKTKMPQQALINFTFEQCFSYYNWEGAVRVPACLQCADKLSKLVGQSIQQNIVQSPLTKKHFFL